MGWVGPKAIFFSGGIWSRGEETWSLASMLLQCAAQADLRSAKEACINDKVKAAEKYDTVSSCWLVSCLQSFPNLANNRCPDFNLMKDDYDLSFLDENEKKEFFSEGGKVEKEKRKQKPFGSWN